MSTDQIVERDERTLAVENASYRWAYMLLTYALFIDVMYRGIVRGEAAWDLLALVILGGLFCAVYQAKRKTLTHGWVRKVVLVACFAAAIAALVSRLTVIPSPWVQP